MQKRNFATFKEASNFAKQQAQAIGVTVKLERDGDGWVVFCNQGTASPVTLKKEYHHPPESHSRHEQDNDWLKSRFEEQRKRKEEERKRREIKKKAQEAEAREREERQAYLADKKDYYYGLSEKDLLNLWDRRDETDLDTEEFLILRGAVRKAKGIEPAYHHNVQVCPFCGMVGGNCNCGRS